MDISQALAAVSDEMVAADLIGAPPQVFTINNVDQVEREGKKIARLYLAEFPKPWLASKGMARVMADNWGRETQGWIGHKVELYGEPEVYFGKEKRGGIRITRLSHITQAKTTRTNPRGGKNSTWTVDPLPDTTPAPTLTADDIDGATDLAILGDMWKQHPAQRAAIEARVAAIKAAAPTAEDAAEQPAEADQ